MHSTFSQAIQNTTKVEFHEDVIELSIERNIDPDRKPVHPGQILEDYMQEAGWDQTTLSNILNMSRSNLNKIINGNGGIGPKLANKLAVVFEETSPRFWSNLNQKLKLFEARQDLEVELKQIRKRLEDSSPPSADGEAKPA